VTSFIKISRISTKQVYIFNLITSVNVIGDNVMKYSSNLFSASIYKLVILTPYLKPYSVVNTIFYYILIK